MHFSFTVLTTVFLFICFLAVGVSPYIAVLCLPMFLYLALFFASVLYKEEEKDYCLPKAIHPEKKTACVLYSDLEKICDDIRMAEGICIQNRDENLCFILLCDSGGSDGYWSVGDEEKCRNITAKLKELNHRYGDRFYVFVPKREYSPKKKRYLGCGFDKSIFDLIKYIKNEEIRYSFVYANSHFLHRVKYLVTVDSSCEVEPGGLAHLVGYMTTGLNRPKIVDSEIVEGYGILAQTSKEYTGYGVINADVYDLLIEDPDFASVSSELKVLNISHDYIKRSKLDVKMTCLKRDIKALKNIFLYG